MKSKATTSLLAHALSTFGRKDCPDTPGTPDPGTASTSAGTAKMSRERFVIRTFAAVLAMLAVPYATAADARAVYQFNLPEQSLSEALKAIGQQTTTNILFDPGSVLNKTAPALRATLTPKQAIEHVLQGTDLTAKQSATDTVLVQPPKAPSVPLSTLGERGRGEAFPPLPLGEGQGEGINTEGEGKGKGFWSRFRLAQADTASRSDASNAEGERQKTSENSSENSQKRIEIEEIVVTGTHIRGVAPAGSPVTTFTRSDIDKSGAGTIGEFLRKIPQNFALTDQETVQNNGTSKNSDVNVSHGSAFNLRGLGAGATLTLLDGQRVAPSGSAGGLVDVSLIPLSALDRIEILTDGASAIYGADAVGGVVNFILRRDFSGAQTSLLYGDSSQGGGAQLTASQLLGTSWQGGNAMLIYEYMNQDSVDAAERDFIRPIPALTPGPFTFVPEQRRNSVLANVRHTLTPNLEVSARGLFSKRHYVEDISAFSGLTNSAGDAQTSGGALGLELDIAGGWGLTTAADYSVTKQEAISSTTPGTTVEQSIRSGSSGIDARLHGPLFNIRGAAAQASIGASARQEKFDQATTLAGSLQRDVNSAYAELFVPLITPASSSRAAHRLEISIAGRYDDYDDFGSSGLKPKVGIAWMPTEDFGLRASWSESFRAPLLAQMDTSTTSAVRYFVFNLPDPASQTGSTPTIFTIVPGNPDLGPEKSTSFTVGLDVTPEALPDFKASLTYYETEYEEKISTPPLTGSIFLLYQQAAQLAPFINRSPDPAVVAGYYAQGVLNFLGIPPSGIRAIYDSRNQNISSLNTSGFELSVSNTFHSAVGSFAPFVAANYIVSMDSRAASTTPEVALFDKIFTPARLKARGGLSWSRSAVATTMSVNYVNQYENNTFIPSVDIDDWITIDWHLQCELGKLGARSILQDLSVALNVQNLTDEAPPEAFLPASIQTFDFGYDATNSSAMGRFISLQLVKRW